MKLITKAARGVRDVLPEECWKRRVIEGVLVDQAQVCGFGEIRTPGFEHTELFDRAVGQDTDVVQKEMYTFCDKNGRSLTLKPEGTAGVVRAVLEHGLLNQALPLKLFYITPCYRYEKPQSGRYREFYQFGIEMFGARQPAADAEIIKLAADIFDRLGLREISLEINSIGCESCRGRYLESLRSYLREHCDDLCEACCDRLERNPLRVLDCKNPNCVRIAENGPNILDFLCDDCADHFGLLQKNLDAVGVSYDVNPKIVRGLDYYNRTVFEFVTCGADGKITVCGGGRYDGLVQQMGGPDVSAVGMAIGFERLLLLLESQKVAFSKPRRCDVFIASIGEKATVKAFCLTETLRKASLWAECDCVSRNLKAQLKYADKIGARFSMVLGDEELNKGCAWLKAMDTGQKFEVQLDDRFLQDFVAAESTIDAGSLLEK